MLGTLLLGDISINPNNNPINFPQAFKDKLLNVHVVQIPHHGSSKNWDFTSFEVLNIGRNINRWENHVAPTYEKYIEPTKYSADIIINNNLHFEKGLDILTSFLKTKLPKYIFDFSSKE